MSDLYRDPEIYDLAHDHATTDQVLSLLVIAERLGLGDSVEKGGLWLEPACGSGRLLHALQEREVTVAGFDIEPAMVDYCRERLSKDSNGDTAPLFVASMQEFAHCLTAGSVVLAYNLINTIRHLESDACVCSHLADMQRVLAPQGRYLVGISLSNYSEPVIDEDVWVGERPGLRVTQVVQGLPPENRRETIVSHTMIERDDHTGDNATEHRDESYTLRTYSFEEWRELVAGSALRIAESFDIFGEPNTPFDGGYTIFSLAHE